MLLQTITETNSVVKESPVAYVVDGDRQIQISLSDFFIDLGFEVAACASAADLLEQIDDERIGLILINTQLPDAVGIELQRQLNSMRIQLPVIFMSAESDVSESVEAMKAGAIDFLLKPLDRHSLRNAVSHALRKSAARRQVSQSLRAVTACTKKLTPREHEMFVAVTSGLLNKQIAFQMGISEIMVKVHRGRMMRKMQARSLPELVRKFELVQAMIPDSQGPETHAWL